jgi:hypothetical protein
VKKEPQPLTCQQEGVFVYDINIVEKKLDILLKVALQG